MYNYFDVEEISIDEEVIPSQFLFPSFTLAADVHVTHRADEDDDDNDEASMLPSRRHPRLDPQQENRSITDFSPTTSSPHSSLPGSPTSRAPVMKDVKPGQIALLPLWAAIPLHRDGYIRCFTPPTFAISTFREFKADPLAPSLYLKSPYFYEAGIRICRLLGPPTSSGAMSAMGKDVVAQLVRLYQLRYLKIIRAARKKGFELSDARERLTESERYLLDVVLTDQREEREWSVSLL